VMKNRDSFEIADFLDMAEIRKATLARNILDNAKIDRRFCQPVVLVFHDKYTVADAGQVFAEILVLVSLGQVHLEVSLEVANLNDAKIGIRSYAAMCQHRPRHDSEDRNCDQQSSGEDPESIHHRHSNAKSWPDNLTQAGPYI